ncbi:MAG: hypothetical protein KZQ82_03445 [Candidatus Thiodiazotropha sp. (ex Lucinoma annulata)]|nr:hypothetical protein [Candidatus Thiodiazotropha sp. (ex Lucinoma annulata)]
MLQTAGLSLEQAPPISIPFKYFFTASLLFIVASLLLVMQGSDLVTSRWSPTAIGLTHLITTGFLAQVMTGAMMQLLPVLAGTPVSGVVIVNWIIHITLLAGTVMLVVGFLLPQHLMLILGAGALTTAFIILFTSTGIALLKSARQQSRARSLGIGWVSIIPTVLLGCYLVASLSGFVHIDDLQPIITLHLSWGLLGWVGIVLFATILELVPMFYVTPTFSKVLKQWLLPVIFLCLIIFTISRYFSNEFLKNSLLLIVLAFFVIGLSVLINIYNRKRLIVDTTLLYIWTGIASLLIAAVVWLSAGSDLIIGGLLLGGVCMTIPIGIIYKVIPFLCWFHLQALQIKKRKLDYSAPSMKHFIQEKHAKYQYFFHLSALCLFFVALLISSKLMILVGVLFTCSSLYLFKNILYAYIAYHEEQNILCS